jgi:NADPH-dependent 2,4-dienoyl-CoA reductase/sulfur reductase-like enzyme/Fe-S-cluster-containing hydrogenase component 2
MSGYRITKHPILPITQSKEIEFYWNNQKLFAKEGETIASALFANGIRVFGHHHKDGAPQGIFCANGQCAQCMVIANGKPVKSCMELVQPGMKTAEANGLPELPLVTEKPVVNPPREIQIPVLIIGGGPAGLSAAIELGKLGIHVLLIDDKHRLGGKLVLQTHRFFGSTDAVYAGTRGIDIATRLEKEVRKYPSVEIWLHSTALAVFSDKKVGVLREGNEYVLVIPQVVLVASGAREKFLAFRGNTLPGVYGAGAFQTLVNRDLVKPAEKLFIVGGGNVGLIAGYHALQAGINVVGLVEALPECGGYKVHKDKLVRMGVPIYTSHTVLSANGSDYVESVTIAQVDSNFKPIPGTEKSFECDSVLIAVGLDPVNEFFTKAREFDVPAYAAGDAEEIAEASAAMFSGKIKGFEIARFLGANVGEVPQEWYRTGEILKSKPGSISSEFIPDMVYGVSPVIHCSQEIPCNPCASICPQGLIYVDPKDIRHTPAFLGNSYCCGVCERCVAFCPGLAITLVDSRYNPEYPIVSIPFEFNYETIKEKDMVTVLDTTGKELGNLEVIGVDMIKNRDRTLIVKVRAPRVYAREIAGIRIQESRLTQPMDHYVEHISDDTIVCRCERVTAGEIRQLIHGGMRDINEIKAVTRAGMGACGSKTCNALIHRLFRDEGIKDSEVVDQTRRPIFVEVPLSVFAGVHGEDEEGGSHE